MMIKLLFVDKPNAIIWWCKTWLSSYYYGL